MSTSLPSITKQSATRELADIRHLFVGLVCVLLCVGVQMVHSASLSSMPGQREYVFLHKHLAFLLVSVISAVLVSRIDASFWQKHAWTLWMIFLALVVAVLIPGIGTRVNGAQRWLRAGGLSIQPSELGRLVMPMLAARILCDLRTSAGFGLKTIPITFAPLIALPFVIAEPDLGATVFLGTSFVLALFLGGWPLKYFLTIAALAVPAAISLLALKSYQLKRIAGFVAAWQDLSQAPWQIRQSLMSMGSGGLQGTGIGGGFQKLSYLPEANTDFVFAVVGEELGLAGTLTIVVVWLGVYLTGRASLRDLPKRSFAYIFGSTLVIQMTLQALANVAVVTAMVPPKGVPHPFISYGGTNLLVNVTAVGLIVGLSRSEQKNSAAKPVNEVTMT